MNKKGFTLIEIIAVIVILGIIMLIAVPSVTHQIMLSRKSAYVTNAKSFLEVADNSYRGLDYGEYLEEKEIIIAPLVSLKMDAEDLQKSPFATYDKSRSYIVIKPTKNNFKSYVLIRDVANYGIVGLSSDDINRDSVQTAGSDSIQAITDYYTCTGGEVNIIPTKAFIFKGLEYYANDYELPNSDKCDNENNKPVIRFSSVELENGDNYTVNYDNNSGTGVMEPTVCVFGRDCTLRDMTFTKTGYHFTKWTKNKNGRGVSYVNKQVVKNITFLDHVTLFAQWAINSNTLVVNASGGSGGGTWKQDYNTKKTIDTKKNGHTFKAWTSTGECGTYANTAKTTYTFPPGYETTCKLTATWDINTSTLVVDANGGTGGGTWTQEYNTTKAVAVTRTGYTFNGWDKSGTCGTYGNTASTTYTFPADDKVTCTLKAKWKIHTNSLTVNANGGTGGFSAVTQNYNTTKAIAVAKTGYTFSKWTKTGTCGSVADAASATYTFPSNDGTSCTLKAEWTINTSKLVVDANGGTGGFSAVTQNYNTTKAVSVSKTGYTFSKWTATGTCGTYANTASMTYTFPANSGTTCTLKAEWTINKSTLTVDANSGSGGGTWTQNYNTTKAVSVSRTGYTFGSWTKSGTCNTIGSGASFTYTYPTNNGTTCTIKANWTIHQNTLTVDANGGSGGGTWKQNYNTTKAVSVSRSGYKFNGWTKSGTCNTIGSGASFTYTYPSNSGTTCTIKASWKAVQTKWTFGYTGSAQSFTLEPGTYTFELWGAGSKRSDKNDYDTYRGFGAYIKAKMTLASKTTFYAYVGQNGDKGSGGWNGGGTNNAATCRGGGATDIRTINGAWNNSNGLLSRIIVAGGSGGCGENHSKPGYGGIYEGGTGEKGSGSRAGAGGTQTAGGVGCKANGLTGKSGSFGTGGNSNAACGGGGGGGWYGGGSAIHQEPGGTNQWCGAGGGSSYANHANNNFKYPSGYKHTASTYTFTLLDTKTGTAAFNYLSTRGVSRSGAAQYHGYIIITLNE